MAALSTSHVPFASWLALACALAVGCGASDGAKNDSDPSFDHWCDQHLCDWKTVQGRIERTGTWHEKDFAVSFLDTPTEISQRLSLADDNASCLLFDTIADVASEARLSIELDFNDDGVADAEQQLPTLGWKSVPFPVRAPLDYDGLRINVVKRGSGRAILAQMRIVVQRGCAGEPLTLAAGSACSGNQVCKSQRCEQGHCALPAAGAAPVDASLTPSASSE